MLWLLAQVDLPVDYKELTAYGVVTAIAVTSVYVLRNMVTSDREKFWALWTSLVVETQQNRKVFEGAIKVMETDSKADREAYLTTMAQVTTELRVMNESLGELKRSAQWRIPPKDSHHS
jgi:uncharacterized protein YbjQ (UPF0145 family)